MQQNIFRAKYKKIKYIPNIMLAIILNFILKYVYKKKNIVLVGGHAGEKYQDNSAAIHQYLLEEKKNITLCWMTHHSLNKSNLNINGEVIKLGSIKNYLFYLNAKTCYFSHSLSTDIAPIIDKLLPHKYKPIRVHLSHGIEGLKKNLNLEHIEDVDFYICSSNQEKVIKKEEWGLEEKKLIVTGVPRYDELYNHLEKTSKNTILYAPTWREWLYLSGEEEFFNTEFYINLVNLISDKYFNDILHRKGFRLEVVLHPFMHNKLSIIKKQVESLSNINIMSDKVDVGKKIRESALLITDYSSICWDFLYLDKSVIFYQFDQTKYLLERGSYIDLNSSLFGEVVLTKEKLIECIEEKLFSESYEKKSHNYKAYKEKYFAFFDNKNCKRVVEATLNV